MADKKEYEVILEIKVELDMQVQLDPVAQLDPAVMVPRQAPLALPDLLDGLAPPVILLELFSATLKMDNMEIEEIAVQLQYKG